MFSPVCKLFVFSVSHFIFISSYHSGWWCRTHSLFRHDERHV